MIGWLLLEKYDFLLQLLEDKIFKGEKEEMKKERTIQKLSKVLKLSTTYKNFHYVIKELKP